jgi:molybdopterin-guanine dinucleotide biosynthesis protein A
MTAQNPQRLPLTGAVLAGGRARRFGGFDKTEIRLGPDRLRDRLVRLLEGFCDEVLISSNTLTEKAGVRVVPDQKTGQGPLGAIASCLAAARHPWLLVVAGDMPFIAAPALIHLWQEREKADIVIPRSPDGLQPLAALYHRRCLPAVTRQLAAKNYKIKDFFPAVRVRTVLCTDHPGLYPETAFLNINSPDDLARADRILNHNPAGPRQPGRNPGKTN